jgi:ankyrin repeat protein
MAAAREGHLDIVRLLLDRGVDPNASLPGDGTALIEAASEGHVDVAEVLLQRGAAVNLVPQGAETALIRAADEGYLPMVQLLVANGADVNQGIWVVRTGAIWFTSTRNDAIRTLARQEPQLRTPLSAAREDAHTDVVDFLISAGARD